MKDHLRRWGAIWLLFAMFLASWIAQLLSQITVVTGEARNHGQRFTWEEFWPQFLASTFENWQSEFLQLGFQGLLLLGPWCYVLWQADQNVDKRDLDEVHTKLDRLLDRSSESEES